MTSLQTFYHSKQSKNIVKLFFLVDVFIFLLNNLFVERVINIQV